MKSITDFITLFLNCLEYNIYRVLIFLGLIISYLIINNKEKKITKILMTILSTFVIILIFIYYKDSILNSLLNKQMNILYVSYFISVIYLLIFSVTIYKFKYKSIYFIFYIIIIVNSLFSIFMTYYLKHNQILILSTGYPIFIINNVIIALYFSFLTIKAIRVIINSTFKGVK